jgi:hypothetical protein
MEVDTDGMAVAAEGAATANGAVLSVDRPPVAGAEAAGEDLPLRPQVVALDDALGMDLALEVAARLNKVLANMDPIYHEVFISMYCIRFRYLYSSVPSLYAFMCVICGAYHKCS